MQNISFKIKEKNLKMLLAALLILVVGIFVVAFVKMKKDMRENNLPDVSDGNARNGDNSADSGGEIQQQIEEQKKTLDVLRDQQASDPSSRENIANIEDQKKQLDALREQHMKNPPSQADIEKQKEELDRLRESSK